MAGLRLLHRVDGEEANRVHGCPGEVGIGLHGHRASSSSPRGRQVGGAGRGTEERGPRLEDHLDGHPRQQRGQAALRRGRRAGTRPASSAGQDLGGDARPPRTSRRWIGPRAPGSRRRRRTARRTTRARGPRRGPGRPGRPPRWRRWGRARRPVAGACAAVSRTRPVVGQEAVDRVDPVPADQALHADVAAQLLLHERQQRALGGVARARSPGARPRWPRRASARRPAPGWPSRARCPPRSRRRCPGLGRSAGVRLATCRAEQRGQRPSRWPPDR